MIDIALISPPSPTPGVPQLLQFLGSRSQLGLGYIASLLEKNGYTVKCLNLYLGLRDIRKFEQFLLENKPKIIGFSTMTETYKNGVILSRIAKNLLPDTKIVFGGPHVTFLYQEALSEESIDIVVRREGEYAMLELADLFILKKGNIENIIGICYKSKLNRIVRNPPRPALKNLDMLPFPKRVMSDLDGMLSSEYKTGVYSIITSRGCPGNCKFCAASALSGGKYRHRSVENVIEEIKLLMAQKRKLFLFIQDDTFTADIERLKQICKEFKKLDIKWSAESRVDVMNKAVAKLMKDSGCVGLQFGVESGSQKMLDAMGKGTNLEQIKKAVKSATKAKILIACTLMIGLPEDTKESIKQTFELAKMLQSEYGVSVLVGCFLPYPGTYYWRHSDKLGINILTKDYNKYSVTNPIIDTPNIKHTEVRNLFFEGTLTLYSPQSKSLEHVSPYAKEVLKSLEKQGYVIQDSLKSLLK